MAHIAVHLTDPDAEFQAEFTGLYTKEEIAAKENVELH
jgi:hypothetical protein